MQINIVLKHYTIENKIMSTIERFGVAITDKPIFTKAPIRTSEKLKEADKIVEDIREMM